MAIQEHVPDGTFVKEVAALVKQQPSLQKLGRGQHILMVGDKHELIGEPLLPEPKALETSTLQSIVDYLPFVLAGEPVVHVVSPDEVRIVSPDVGDERQQFTYMVASAAVPEIQYARMMPLDTFIIQLQTQFGPTADRERVLQFVGGLTAGLSAEITDDGVSQAVTARKGITRADEPKRFANPVKLSPFRTFAEIEQPISDFVLRLGERKEGEQLTANAALYEADGGAWRREAIAEIGDWLRAKLPNVPILA